MKNTDAPSFKSFPTGSLTGALGLTVVMLLALVWLMIQFHRQDDTGQQQNLRLKELCGTITHLDEVLTMSARLAATTGDTAWEARYRQFEGPLDLAIKEAINLTAEFDNSGAAQTDAANLKLVEMENSSFALVRAGKAPEARTILFAGAYEDQKKIYAGGIATLIQHLNERLAANQKHEEQRNLGVMLGFGFCIFSLIIIWLLVLGKLKRGHEMSLQINRALQTEAAERELAEKDLRAKTTFLEAQINASIDGILVVDENARKILQNQRFNELLKIPPHIADDPDDEPQRQWVTGQTKNPAEFIAKVVYLYAHPEETSRDEIELADGTVLDRYSAPVVDQKGTYYGRIWSFRDITASKRNEEAMQRQQAELRALFDLIPAMIWFKDTENRILRVNQRVAKIAGMAVEEIEGKPSVEIYPKEAAGYYAADLKVIHSGLPELGFVETLRDLEGNELWVQTDKVPYCDKDGKVIGIIVMAQDITDRKRAEESLRESEEKFRQLADNISDVFWMTSPDFTVIHYVSAGYEKIWGRSTGSLYANPHQWIEAILPEERERALAAFAPIMGNEPQMTVEYRIARPDGSARWILDRGFQVRDAAGKLIRLAGIASDITERKLADDELLWKTALLEAQVNSSLDGMVVVDQRGKKILQNQRFTDLWNTPAHIADDSNDATQLRWNAEMTTNPGHFRERVAYLDAHPNETSREEIELKNGAFLDRYTAPVIGKDGKNYGRIRMIRDITERKKLEAQLFQSQKLETVGKLAGGVAHEFNSILTAIIGQSELMLGDLPPGSSIIKNAVEINKAANRAATLTRQLLAYGRKQILQAEILDLNTVLTGMEETLRHLLGRATEVRIAPDGSLKHTNADAGQIEQVIMNMAINARDAMPNGGKLMLETANVSFDEHSVGRYAELKPGEYVMLAITDTGVGMSAEVKARIFEPFFSTKEVGQGTGLGLSTCYGIIKQSGGHISVYSEVARGTSFKIYLPQMARPAEIPPVRPSAPGLPGGTETILLVEDDPALREMAASLLRRLGYTVLAAGEGVEALSLKQQRDIGHIDLLFTDVVMPHMSGKELAERMLAIFPHTKVLFTSAYTENAVVLQGVLKEGVSLLQKPFTPSALAHKLREVLDQPSPVPLQLAVAAHAELAAAR